MLVLVDFYSSVDKGILKADTWFSSVDEEISFTLGWITIDYLLVMKYDELLDSDRKLTALSLNDKLKFNDYTIATSTATSAGASVLWGYDFWGQFTGTWPEYRCDSILKL